MRGRLGFPVLAILGVVFVLACGKIPTDSEDFTPTNPNARAYTDSDWGFQISIPDPAIWGWSSQTSYQDRASNGLPLVQIAISRIPFEGSIFRPRMIVEPRGVSRDLTLETFVASLEEDLKARYIGYRADEKRVFTLSTRGAVEWTFRTVPLPGIGDRFLITVVMDGRKGYVLLGSGLFSSFPLDGFREIVASLRFL